MAFRTEILGFCTQIRRSWPVFNDQKMVPEARFRYQSPCFQSQTAIFQSQTAIFRSWMAGFGTCPWLVPCHCCAGHQGGQAKMDSMIQLWLMPLSIVGSDDGIRGLWAGVAPAGFTPGCHPRFFGSHVERIVRRRSRHLQTPHRSSEAVAALISFASSGIATSPAAGLRVQ